MQAAHGAPSRGQLSSHRHDLGPAFTVSFSVFPALECRRCGRRYRNGLAGPRVRPVRAGRLLVPKVPNPGSRITSPSARASPTIANTPSTASLAAPLLSPVRAAKRSAISVLFISSLPAVMLCRSAIPGWRIARFQTPTTTNSRLPRRPAAPRRIRSAVADPPVSPHRSRSCISGPIRRGRSRCAPPCARTPTVR